MRHEEGIGTRGSGPLPGKDVPEPGSHRVPEGGRMALNVSLPPELEARVRQRVESGMYGSASEVIREALRVFEVYEKAREAKIEALRTDIAKGLADIEAGRVAPLDIEAVKRRGR